MAQVNDNYVYLTAMNTIRNNLLEISVLFLERRCPWNIKQLALIKLNFMLDRQIDGTESLVEEQTGRHMDWASRPKMLKLFLIHLKKQNQTFASNSRSI